MPELQCTVQTCVHNKQFLCDLDAIRSRRKRCKNIQRDVLRQLSGAKRRGISKCLQRCDRKSIDSDTSKIDCKAVECKYNENCDCHAGKISARGRAMPVNVTEQNARHFPADKAKRIKQNG